MVSVELRKLARMYKVRTTIKVGTKRIPKPEAKIRSQIAKKKVSAKRKSKITHKHHSKVGRPKKTTVKTHRKKQKTITVHD